MTRYMELRDPNSPDNDVILCPVDCPNRINWTAERRRPLDDSLDVMATNQREQRMKDLRTKKYRRWGALVGLALLVLLAWTAIAKASPPPVIGTAAINDNTFLERYVLSPHQSPITSEMMVNVDDWYGVPLHFQVAVLGAETSMGDPKLGGKLARVYNFGCIRAFPGWQKTKWGMLANGTIRVGGKLWLRFPSADQGMYAWGRFIKLRGYAQDYLRYPLGKPGHWMIGGIDWYTPFASRYYGANVRGFRAYVAELRAIDLKYIRLARAQGLSW